MKRMILGMLLVLSITGLQTQVWAQNRFTKERHIVRYARIGGGVDQKQGIAKLQWSFSPEQPDELYQVFLKFNKAGDIYFAKRITPEGIDAFGRSKELVELIKREGGLVEFKNESEMDWSKPYVIRLIQGKYVVEGYYETSELEKFFKVLEQILHLRILPTVNNSPQFEMSYTEMEVGDALMFRHRKDWLWKGEEPKITVRQSQPDESGYEYYIELCSPDEL